jgi:CelD/BcsL family acetyltransferase involved in cellulose biosynthesis
MEYRVRTIRDEAGLERLQGEWDGLLERSRGGSIFASFAWNSAWWQFFGKGARLYIVAVSDAEGQVYGIAPLMLRRVGLLRRLEFIGTGLSDAGDFVLDPDHAEGVLGAIFAYLGRHNRAWDITDLDEVPPYSPLARFLETKRPSGLRVLALPRNDCPYIPVPATWDAYTKTLQRKPRQHLEGFARRVVEETGATFRLVTEEAEAPAAVERFYALHRARWDTKDDELNPEHLTPEFVAFLEEACRRSASHGSLRLTELCVPMVDDGRQTTDDVDVSPSVVRRLSSVVPIASWVSFLVNGRWSGYMTGFDPAWSAKRPGKVLHGFVMREAMKEGAFEIDEGRGAEPYKYELGAISRQSWRFMLTSNRPRSLMALGLVKGRLRARDLVRRYRERTTGDARQTTTEMASEQ